MKTLIITALPISNTNRDFLFLPAFQAASMLELFKANSFDTISTIDEEVDIQEIVEKDFWKNMFLIMKENGTLQLSVKAVEDFSPVKALLRMNGF